MPLARVERVEAEQSSREVWGHKGWATCPPPWIPTLGGRSTIAKAKWILSIFYSTFEACFLFHSQSIRAIVVCTFPSSQNLSERAAVGGFTGQFFSWFSFHAHVLGASFKLPIWMEIELGSLGCVCRPQESPGQRCSVSPCTSLRSQTYRRKLAQADPLQVQHGARTSKVHVPGSTSLKSLHLWKHTPPPSKPENAKETKTQSHQNNVHIGFTNKIASLLENYMLLVRLTTQGWRHARLSCRVRKINLASGVAAVLPACGQDKPHFPWLWVDTTPSLSSPVIRSSYFPRFIFFPFDSKNIF